MAFLFTDPSTQAADSTQLSHISYAIENLSIS
jgi:hypothetical protein